MIIDRENLSQEMRPRNMHFKPEAFRVLGCLLWSFRRQDENR